jgi:hypothetical protein
MLRIANLSLSIFCFILYSCASPQFSRINVSMPRDFEFSNAEIKDKIPLRAGLYLKPDMKNYVKKGPLGSAVTHTSFLMGDALCGGSERMLRNIFKDVLVIDHLESDLSARNIDVIVTPDLVGITAQNKMVEGSRLINRVIELVIKWNIVSLDGKSIYVNTITGESPAKASFSFLSSGIEEDERNNMLRVVKDQFRKAQDDLYNNGWWKKQWWKSNI